MPGSVRRCCRRDRPGEWDRSGLRRPRRASPDSRSRRLRPRRCWGLCPPRNPRLGLGRSACETPRALSPPLPAVRPGPELLPAPRGSCSGTGSGPGLPWPCSAGTRAVRVPGARGRSGSSGSVLGPGAVPGAAGTVPALPPVFYCPGCTSAPAIAAAAVLPAGGF